jgi:hypothetical protein
MLSNRTGTTTAVFSGRSACSGVSGSVDVNHIGEPFSRARSHSCAAHDIMQKCYKSNGSEQ